MNLPKRKPTRLPNYDYSRDGYYFITICTDNKKYILSNVVGQGLAPAEIQLTAFGKIANTEITDLENRYKNIKIDKYVIMPNHIHAIIVIQNKTAGASPSPTISNVIGWLKYNITKQINKTHNKVGENIFQRLFHDHVIRNEDDYLKIWNYIDTNPQKWEDDCFYIE